MLERKLNFGKYFILRRVTITHFHLLPALVLLILAGGCGPGLGTGRSSAVLPPTADRLVKTYTDLASRRFQILADFEEPVQATIFHRKMKGGDEPLEVTTEQAQKATGVGSLKMNLLNSDQYVIARDSPESEWSLYRDWSHYHLLLFSVFSPRELGGFVCEIRSGQEKQRIYRHPPLLYPKAGTWCGSIWETRPTRSTWRIFASCGSSSTTCPILLFCIWMTLYWLTMSGLFMAPTNRSQAICMS